MKKLIFSFCVFFFTATAVFCQDYVVDYPLNNGYTLVYKKLPPPVQYQNAPEKTYGVINSENKIVVPIEYKSIYNCGEKGIFIIKDGKDEAGLFSVSAKKVIVEPQFYFHCLYEKVGFLFLCFLFYSHGSVLPGLCG